jgi:anti-sigma factor RsiW
MDQKLSCGSRISVEAYVRGAVSEEERAEFQQHLERCEECQQAEQHVRVVVLWEKCRQDPSLADAATRTAEV